MTAPAKIRDIPNLEPAELPRRAQAALERVCSGANLDPAYRYDSSRFVDHVNDLEFHGSAGAQQSVDLYKRMLSNVEIRVQEQVVEGHRVTSRFVVTGRSHARRVRFGGITISRFEDGLIAEDWSMIDTFGLVHQLGLWRALLLGVKQWRVVSTARRSTVRGQRCATP